MDYSPLLFAIASVGVVMFTLGVEVIKTKWYNRKRKK